MKQNLRTKLSVNVNKIAWLRNARGGNMPDLVKMSMDIEAFGAQGITVHPRPDERHITYRDVYDLKKVVKTEYNIEGYPNDRFMKLVLDIVPDQCTLVPDPPGVLTSNTGWDTIKNKEFLQKVIKKLHKKGIRVSLFVNPDKKMVIGAKNTGADRIEFYTGDYAKHYTKNRRKAIKPFVKAAKIANKMNIGINAGHDLDLVNLKYFSRKIPNLLEVSIGHALISDALYLGMKKTVKAYLKRLK